MKFSIIVPHYGESITVISVCRESIRKAIVRFGAPDDVEVIEEYGVDGVSAARNRGMDRARGEWFLFVDADDVVEEEWLTTVDRAISDNPGAEIVAWGENSGAALWSGLWNKAYRRCVVPRHGFRPYAHGEDRLFIVEALLNANAIATVDRSLYNYRPSDGSVTRRPRSAQWVLDTVGYSMDMLRAFGLNENRVRCLDGLPVPARLYHDMAVWILEECVSEMCYLCPDDFARCYREWAFCLPQLWTNRCFSRWSRFAAWSSDVLGWSWAKVVCFYPRKLKRMIKSLWIPSTSW